VLLLALHLPKSCTKTITTHVLQIITYTVREKGAQRRTKISFGRAAVVAKRHVSGRSDVEQCEKIKPVAIAIMELHLPVSPACQPARVIFHTFFMVN